MGDAAPARAGTRGTGRPAGTRQADEQRVWRCLLQVAGELSAQIDAQLLAGTGLSLADLEILSALSAERGGRLRMTELATRTFVSKSRLTHRVGRLAEEGLVRRVPHPTDRRGAFAQVTPAGRARQRRASRVYEAAVADLCGDSLGARDVAALDRACSRLQTAFAAREASGRRGS